MDTSAVFLHRGISDGNDVGVNVLNTFLVRLKVQEIHSVGIYPMDH